VGWPGNEKADELAKLGTEDVENPSTEIPLISNNIARNLLRKRIEEYWNEGWINLPTCRQTKHFFPEVNKSKALDYTKCRRAAFSAAVQLITGHNFLKRHESLVNEEGSNKCRNCEEEAETTYHVLSECPKHTYVRHIVLGDPYPELPYDIKMAQIQEFLFVAQLPTFIDILHYNKNKNTESQDATQAVGSPTTQTE